MDMEKQLIRDLKKDNGKAYEKLFNIYHKKIYYFALGYLKHKEKAECIVQTVFLKLWEIRHQLDEEQSLNNLLYKIAKNNILNHIRHNNYYKEYCVWLKEKEGKQTIDNSTNENINLNDVKCFFKKEIEKMPPKRKSIFLMSREEHFTNDDIAKTLNISKRTVDNQIYRAIKQLKQSMLLENL